MARINTYERDTSISGLDLLVGSEFYLDSGVPKYRTKNYNINDLSTFFGLNTNGINSRLSSYLGVLNEDGSFTYSSSFASQTLSTVATAGYASASFVTNLGAIVGTLNADGTLSQLSQAFADQVLNVTSSTKFASTSFATNLAGSFGTYNADGSIAALSSSFANNVLSTMNTSSLASASSVTQLTATLSNDYRTTTATNTQINESVATETSARASSITTLNSSISIKPNILRATSAPTITQRITAGSGQSGAVTTAQDPAMGSLWIDITQAAYTGGGDNTRPKNEMYVLQGSFGSAAWLKTQDSSLLNTITSAATATSELSTLNTANIAKAAQITKLNAQFTLDSSDPPLITGVAGVISTANNDVKNTAIATANSASATREANLSATAVKVFKQTSAPSVTVASSGSAALSGSHANTNSLAHNSVSGTRVVGQTVTGTGISDNVVIISITDANNIIVSSPQTIASGVTLSFAKPQAPLSGSLWYDTTAVSVVVPQSESNGQVTLQTTTDVPKNELHVLATTGSSPYYAWVANPDALKASTASVKIVSDASSNINGKLSAVHGVTVNAGGAIAGMKLLADGTTGSSVKFQANKFVLQTGNANANTFAAPFAVVGSEVLIDGSLKIGGAAGARIDEMAVADLDLQKSSSITIAGRKIFRTSGSSAWDAQVYSGTSFKGSAVVVFTPGNTNKYLSMGLTTDPAANASYTSIDYAWYLHINGNLYIYENGTQQGASYGSYSTSSIIKIEYDGVEVKYFHGSALKRTVSATADQVLFMDSSFYDTTPTSGQPSIKHFDFAATNHEVINRARKSQGQVGGWNITSDAITGGNPTNASNSGFATASGIKLGAAGWISSKNFYIAENGNAGFKGTLTIGSTDLTADNALNENTTAANVGLENVNNTSDDTVLGNAATASNTQDKTDGSVGGWTLESNYIFSGTKQTSNDYSSSGITLYSGGALRAKEFYIANNGDAFFKGDISAASGTFGGNITIGVHTEAVFKASAAGIQLGNTTFADAEFSVTPAGVLKTVSGTVGGWTLSENTLSSVDNKVTISSLNSNLPSVESSISGQPSGSYNGSSVQYNKSFNTGSGGSINASYNYVGLSSGSTVSNSSNQNTANGWDGAFPHSSISFTANSSSAGKPVTIKVNLSNSNSFPYLTKVITTGGVNSYTFSGNYEVKVIMQIFRVDTGDVIASTTKLIGGTSPQEDSSGNLSISVPDNNLMSVNLSSTYLISGKTYYIKTGIQYVRLQGTFGTANISAYQVNLTIPKSSGGVIVYAIGRTEMIGGGLQVIKGSDAFLSLNRNQNTDANPFILSRGFSRHQGDLYVEGSLDAGSKNFKIKHPLASKHPTHYLVHSSIESPRADLIYRGKVKIFNEVTLVNIDEDSNMTSGTFEALCRNVQCFTTNETSWGAIKARVEGNLLIITAKEIGSYDTISWMVVGERKDASIYESNNTDNNGRLIVELEK